MNAGNGNRGRLAGAKTEKQPRFGDGKEIPKGWLTPLKIQRGAILVKRCAQASGFASECFCCAA